ncbi:hypothetical protein [Ornithinimicrobium panacihumi]|uniref:hypothetical protein n=1 Tax=Ornithinimicrobium panacihumi TaxID=2008449 RepID=UPI003F89F781
MPWVTLVLTTVAAVLAVMLVRPDGYAATSTVTAATPRVAQQTAVALTRLDLGSRVATELELDPSWRGDVHYEIDHRPQDRALLITARSTDPRLSAVAADTAAALAVTDLEEGELSLASTAQVPTAPERQISRWWIALALGALALAGLVEWRYRRWELRHTPASARTAQVGR